MSTVKVVDIIDRAVVVFKRKPVIRKATKGVNDVDS